MDIVTILFVTGVVLAVVLVVLAVVAIVVLLPPVRRALAERSRGADESEADVEGAVAEPEAASSDRAEPEQR